MQNEQLTEPEAAAPFLKEQINTSEINPTPDNPPWNGLAALGVWLASVFFIAVFPFLFLIPYAARQNVDLTDQTKMLEFFRSDSTAIILQLIAVLPAHLFTLILGWAVVTRLRRFSFKQTLGWNWGGFKVWHLVIVSFICYAVGIILIGVFGHQETEFEQILKSSRTAVYLVAFFGTFTAPIVEEVVYRGILYSAFQQHFGRIFSVAFVTLLFAVVHVPQYYPAYGTIFTILFVSLVLTLIRVRSGNLLPCIVLHTIFNGVQSVLLVFEPYLRNLADQYQNDIPALIRFLM